MSGSGRWVASFFKGGAARYAIVWARDAAAAARHAASLGLAAGAERIDVAPETANHNIPDLDPVAWGASCEALAELGRRIRGEALDGLSRPRRKRAA